MAIPKLLKAVRNMIQGAEDNIDLCEEMEKIDEAIIECSEMIHELSQRRYELLAMKQNLEMDEVFESIIESGLSPNEVMEVIAYATSTKKKHPLDDEQ